MSIFQKTNSKPSFLTERCEKKDRKHDKSGSSLVQDLLHLAVPLLPQNGFLIPTYEAELLLELVIVEFIVA